MRATWAGLGVLAMVAACDPAGSLVVGDTGGAGGDDPVPPADTPVGDTDPGDETDPADTTDTTDTTDTPEPPPEPETSIYDGATLVIVSPEPAELFESVDGVIPLEGYVYSANGRPFEFRDLHWSVRESGAEVFVGREGTAQLAYGVYTVDIDATLPNGDVLSYAVGGVRVQHPLAGIYAGSVAVDALLTGLQVPLSTSCLGSLVFEVSLDGQDMVGDGGCTLAFPIGGLSFDLAYDVDGVIANPGVSGDLSIDVGLFGVPLPWGGTFRGNDALEGSFQGLGVGLFGFNFDLSGTLAADKISPYVTP